MSEMTITFGILAVTIAFLIWGRFPSDLVAVGSLLSLYFTGMVTASEALSGFSNSTVLLVGALFIVGEGLTRTGVTAWAGERLISAARGSGPRLLVLIMAGTALLSAFVSNTGTVATLMPAVIIAAWGVGSVPSRFLIPLAFAANAGGVLTLTGTPPNVVVAESLASHGYRAFDFLEYSLIGLPLLVVAIIYMMLIGQRLLPKRSGGAAPRALQELLDDISATYAIDGHVYRLHVRAGSPLVGRTLAESGFASEVGSVLRVEAGRASATGVRPRLAPIRSAARSLRAERDPRVLGRTLEVDDVIHVSADPEAVHRAEVEQKLGILPVEPTASPLSEMISRELGVAEVLLAPRSRFIGKAVEEDPIGSSFDVSVLGVRRAGEALGGSDTLALGDSLLVHGTWEEIGRLQEASEDLVVVGAPEEISSRMTDLTARSAVSIAVLVGMVGLMVSGAIPVAISAVLAAAMMIATGCLSTHEAYRAVSWSTVVLIAGMLPMATALESSGGAERVADLLVETLGTLGPTAVLAGIFVVATTLSQIMSNTATAVLMSPIVLTAAVGLGVAPHPLMMALAVAASTAFLTPIGTTTNLMVLGPGNYRFGDYAKVGVPLVTIFLVICAFAIPMIWPYY